MLKVLPNRTIGTILIIDRLALDTSKVLVEATPADMLAFIDRPAEGSITYDKMSDYLVEAFDHGFCTQYQLKPGGRRIQNAKYVWRTPDGDEIWQHST